MGQFDIELTIKMSYFAFETLAINLSYFGFT